MEKLRCLIYVFADGYEVKAPYFGMTGKRQWHLERAHGTLKYVRLVY